MGAIAIDASLHVLERGEASRVRDLQQDLAHARERRSDRRIGPQVTIRVHALLSHRCHGIDLLAAQVEATLVCTVGSGHGCCATTLLLPNPCCETAPHMDAAVRERGVRRGQRDRAQRNPMLGSRVNRS